VASHSNSNFTAKRLFAGIFKILHSIESKAMQNNPKIREDLKKIEASINNPKTFEKIKVQDLQEYKSIVEEILGKKIDTTRINTSDFED